MARDGDINENRARKMGDGRCGGAVTQDTHTPRGKGEVRSGRKEEARREGGREG